MPPSSEVNGATGVMIRGQGSYKQWKKPDRRVGAFSSSICQATDGGCPYQSCSPQSPFGLYWRLAPFPFTVRGSCALPATPGSVLQEADGTSNPVLSPAILIALRQRARKVDTALQCHDSPQDSQRQSRIYAQRQSRKCAGQRNLVATAEFPAVWLRSCAQKMSFAFTTCLKLTA